MVSPPPPFEIDLRRIFDGSLPLNELEEAIKKYRGYFFDGGYHKRILEEQIGKLRESLRGKLPDLNLVSHILEFNRERLIEGLINLAEVQRDKESLIAQLKVFFNPPHWAKSVLGELSPAGQEVLEQLISRNNPEDKRRFLNKILENYTTTRDSTLEGSYFSEGRENTRI